jgi:hypothetical protein
VGQLGAHFDAVCNDPNPMCPGCPSATNPDLLAVCALGVGQCTTIEVSKSPFAECKSDSDCVLRAAACCACGQLSEFSMVVLSKTQESGYLTELGCNLVDCGFCQEPPTPPPGYKAACNLTTNHCGIAVSN